MHTVKMKGKTTDEAINSALEVLKISRAEAEFRIISEGEPGVLGMFGGKDAEVEAWKKVSTDGKAFNLLSELLDKMGFITQITIEQSDEESIRLEIKGEDISRIIGKDGHTIDAIQQFISITTNRGLEKPVRITVDADGYRKKQDRRIEKIAIEIAEEVKLSHKQVVLPPMTAKERRIVHVTVKTFLGLTSFSEGEGDNRSVIIAPAK